MPGPVVEHGHCLWGCADCDVEAGAVGELAHGDAEGGAWTMGGWGWGGGCEVEERKQGECGEGLEGCHGDCVLLVSVDADVTQSDS